jgi:hypothetical protein
MWEVKTEPVGHFWPRMAFELLKQVGIRQPIMIGTG